LLYSHTAGVGVVSCEEKDDEISPVLLHKNRVELFLPSFFFKHCTKELSTIEMMLETARPVPCGARQVVVVGKVEKYFSNNKGDLTRVVVAHPPWIR
jgi:hypothetical protein